MEETRRRRDRQIAHNEEHGIVPRSVVRAVENIMEDVGGKRSREDLVYKGSDPNKRPKGKRGKGVAEDAAPSPGEAGHNIAAAIADLEKRMREAAADLEFETAARLRDEVKRLRDEGARIGGGLVVWGGNNRMVEADY